VPPSYEETVGSKTQQDSKNPYATAPNVNVQYQQHPQQHLGNGQYANHPQPPVIPNMQPQVVQTMAPTGQQLGAPQGQLMERSYRKGLCDCCGSSYCLQVWCCYCAALADLRAGLDGNTNTWWITFSSLMILLAFNSLPVGDFRGVFDLIHLLLLMYYASEVYRNVARYLGFRAYATCCELYFCPFCLLCQVFGELELMESPKSVELLTTIEETSPFNCCRPAIRIRNAQHNHV